MTEMTITANTAETSTDQRSAVLRRQRLNDTIFRHMTRASAIAVLLLLGGVMVSLFIGAWPAISKFGFGFLGTETWNPVTEQFGALAPVYGTLVTAGIAAAARRRANTVSASRVI